MDCAAAAPLLAAHRESALGPVDRAAMQAHLAGCAACREQSTAAEDRVGRLEAVLAAYRVRLSAVEGQLDLAARALAGRADQTDLALLWIALVVGAPAVLDAAGAALCVALDWRVWWWTAQSGLGAGVTWLAGVAVPAAAAGLLIVAWRRLRREQQAESPETWLLAATAAVAGLLAWWPVVGWPAESAALRSSTAWRGTQPDLVYGHLVLGLVALGVAVLVAAPMMWRPAPRSGLPDHGGTEPARRAVRTRLEDALRLLALACFERGGDLLEAAHLAEEEVAALAARLGEANRPGVTLRTWTEQLAMTLVGEPAAGSDRATLRLRKVVERRQLESALWELPAQVRAVTYARLVMQVPLGRVSSLVGVPAPEVPAAIEQGLAALAAFARSPSEEQSSQRGSSRPD